MSPLYSFFYPLSEIRSSRVRIVFVLASLEHTKRILCLAYHMGLLYPAYQWVILAHTLTDIVSHNTSESSEITFSYNKQSYTCSNSNIVLALEKTLLVSFLFHTSTQHLNLFRKLRRLSWDNPEQTDMANSFYDALYAWVSVLHNLTVNYPNIEFNYANNSLVEMITEQFFKLSFGG